MGSKNDLFDAGPASSRKFGKLQVITDDSMLPNHRTSNNQAMVTKQRKCEMKMKPSADLSSVTGSEMREERRQAKVINQEERPKVVTIKEIKIERRTTKSVDGGKSKVNSLKKKKTALASAITLNNAPASSPKPLQRSNDSPIKGQARAKGTTPKKERPASKTLDIVWQGINSELCDDDNLSVAGSLQGSWASRKSVPASSGNRNMPSSKGSMSHHVRADLRLETKRRHSVSALTSLMKGDIKFSPFVKNVMWRSSSKASVKSISDQDQPNFSTNNVGGKKVRFAITSDEKPKAWAHNSSPSRLKLTADNVKKLWWTAEERQTMKRRAQRSGIRFLSTTAKYHLAVEQLLRKCTKEVGTTTHQTCLAEKEAIRTLINHDARGLELAMISALNLESCRKYHRCVKQSVNCVLATQAMWKRSDLKSIDEQWQMIANELYQYTSVAARFARILAIGDARFVRGHYDSVGDVKSSTLVPGLTDESSFSTSSSDENDYLQSSFTI
jgi:hypothetical protein